MDLKHFATAVCLVLLFVITIYLPQAYGYDENNKRKEFIESLPINVLCVPEVSGGVIKRNTGEWESARFRTNDQDKFTAKIGKISDFTGDEKIRCENEKKKLISPTEPVICLKKKYFSGKSESHDNTFFSACEISYDKPLNLKCDDDLIVEPDGSYLSATFTIGLSIGQASIQKGSCRSLN